MQTTLIERSTVPAVRPDILTPEFLQAMRDAGIIEAYLFGSVARGDERRDSDIDLLVKVAPSIRGLAFFGIAHELQKVAGRPVDVMEAIDPAFEPYIRPTLVRVPL